MNKFSKLVLCGLVLVPVLSFARDIQEITPFSRSITKAFKVSNGAQLNINNTYGNVNLHTWNKNEIQAVIKIEAEGSTLDNAKEMSNRVSIQSNQSGNTVSLTTQFNANTGSSFWKQFFGGGTKGGKRHVHIDYEVYIPQSLAASTIKNNYGNVTAENLPGDATIHMNYGAFHIGNVAGSLSMHANYCEGSLSGIKNGEVQANYTDFNIDKVDNLRIQSNYSDYKINHAGNIEIHSNYGDITAESIGSITSNTTYGDYKITTLLNQGDITTDYGDVNIKTLGSQFKGLTVHPNYSDVTVGIPQSRPVRLNIHLTHGDIRTKNISLQQVNKSDNHGNQALEAVSTGAGANAPLIQVTGNYSDVSLSEK